MNRMANRKKLSYVQEQVFMKLLQILPNHNPNDIHISVEDTKNNKAPLTIEILLQRCLEDLLAVASCSSQSSEEIASSSKNGLPNMKDEVSGTLVEELPDIIITHIEKPVDLTDTDEVADAVTPMNNTTNKINNTGIREQVGVEVTGLPSCLVDKEKEAIYDHFYMDRRLKKLKVLKKEECERTGVQLSVLRLWYEDQATAQEAVFSFTGTRFMGHPIKVVIIEPEAVDRLKQQQRNIAETMKIDSGVGDSPCDLPTFSVESCKTEPCCSMNTKPRISGRTDWRSEYQDTSIDSEDTSGQSLDASAESLLKTEVTEAAKAEPGKITTIESPASVDIPVVSTMTKVAGASPGVDERYRFREIDFSESESDEQDNSPDSTQDIEETELPVITFKKRDRDWNILTPVRSSKFSESGQASSLGQKSLLKHGATGSTGLSKKQSSVDDVVGGASTSVPKLSTSLIKKGVFQPAASNAPPTRVSDMSAGPSCERPSVLHEGPSIAQPVFTIESTHKITYNTPVFDTGAEKQGTPSKVIPNTGHINLHAPTVTVNLSPKERHAPWTMHRGLDNLSTPPKREEQVRNTWNQLKYEQCEGCSGHYESREISSHRLGCKMLQERSWNQYRGHDSAKSTSMPTATTVLSDTPTSRGGLATTSSSEFVNGNKNRLATGATNNPQLHDRSATKAADTPVNWDRPPYFGPRFPGTFGMRDSWKERSGAAVEIDLTAPLSYPHPERVSSPDIEEVIMDWEPGTDTVHLVDEPWEDGQVHIVDDKPEDDIASIKKEVMSLFSDVNEGYLDQLAAQYSGPMAVNNICNALLETSYPKQCTVTILYEPEVKTASPIDYYNDFKLTDLPQHVQGFYQNQSVHLLSTQFRYLSLNDIRKVFISCSRRYAVSHRALSAMWKQVLQKAKNDTAGGPGSLRGNTFHVELNTGSSKSKMVLKLLKTQRPTVSAQPNIVPELQKELDFMKQKEAVLAEEADHAFAMALNEEEYEVQGQCIECPCCCNECPFEKMVQCYEGHLACESCLQQYAKESVFGQGKADLKCLTAVCEAAFPKSQLEKALPSEILARYEDRVTEENLNLADLGDLVKCPHCDFRALMDPDDKVFMCMKENCRKETCRYCQVDWKEHFGKKCSEVEKKDETKLRLCFEEKMTQAKVRTCHRCKAQFMKENGCNKMTCRCGAKMCYICRKPNIEYNHFCQHPLDPGKPCSQCKACSLWTDPEEDDNRAVAEIQKAAEAERKSQGYDGDKIIGVPEDQPPKKKARHK